MRSPVLCFPFKFDSILGQDYVHTATRAGTLVASVNHPDGLELHLRLHPSRSSPRVAHCAEDSSGGQFIKRRKQVPKQDAKLVASPLITVSQ